MLLQLLILIAALAVLTFGAEFLVRGAASIARRFGVSSFFIGLTIVGFGTSAPELATGITSAVNRLDDINVGNVVGSNIFNFAVILGLTALICPIPVRIDLIKAESKLVAVVALVPFIALLTDGRITWWTGAAMFAALLVYLWRAYVLGRRDAAVLAEVERELESEIGVTEKTVSRPWLSVGLIVLGLALLVGGAHLLVSSSVAIARALGVSELVIALTIVSAGTSAPELFTSLVAALRRQSDIAVGNILGSNIFNILAILGITSMVREQQVTRQTFMFDIPVMIALSIALIPIMMTQSRISRVEGVVLLLAYGAYVAALFAIAPQWFGSVPAPVIVP